MKLQSLTIVFENCEHVTIDGISIRGFSLDNIIKEISLVAGKRIIIIERAKKSYLAIDLNTLQPNVIKMIRDYNSITHYLLNRQHKKRLEYAVAWGDEEFTNTLEKHEITEDNWLIIRIEEN